jgi:glycosyltransferase involved in cell wall biosynthesis
MRCGLPVVTVDHPQNAVNDLIRGGCGISARLDPDALAEAIQSALLNARILGQAGREKASGYDWEEIVDMIEETYQNTISKVRSA